MSNLMPSQWPSGADYAQKYGNFNEHGVSIARARQHNRCMRNEHWELSGSEVKYTVY